MGAPQRRAQVRVRGSIATVPISNLALAPRSPAHHRTRRRHHRHQEMPPPRPLAARRHDAQRRDQGRHLGHHEPPRPRQDGCIVRLGSRSEK
jgi:hypothetical protein